MTLLARLTVTIAADQDLDDNTLEAIADTLEDMDLAREIKQHIATLINTRHSINDLNLRLRVDEN